MLEISKVDNAINSLPMNVDLVSRNIVLLWSHRFLLSWSIRRHQVSTVWSEIGFSLHIFCTKAYPILHGTFDVKLFFELLPMKGSESPAAAAIRVGFYDPSAFSESARGIRLQLVPMIAKHWFLIHCKNLVERYVERDINLKDVDTTDDCSRRTLQSILFIHRHTHTHIAKTIQINTYTHAKGIPEHRQI